MPVQVVHYETSDDGAIVVGILIDDKHVERLLQSVDPELLIETYLDRLLSIESKDQKVLDLRQKLSGLTLLAPPAPPVLVDSPDPVPDKPKVLTREQEVMRKIAKAEKKIRKLENKYGETSEKTMPPGVTNKYQTALDTRGRLLATLKEMGLPDLFRSLKSREQQELLSKHAAAFEQDPMSVLLGKAPSRSGRRCSCSCWIHYTAARQSPQRQGVHPRDCSTAGGQQRMKKASDGYTEDR